VRLCGRTPCLWVRQLTGQLSQGKPEPVFSPHQVIYVARNPKDVVVSYYHFHHLAKFLPDPVSFDAFLQQFLEGKGKGWGDVGAALGAAVGPRHPLHPSSALWLLV